MDSQHNRRQFLQSVGKCVVGLPLTAYLSGCATKAPVVISEDVETCNEVPEDALEIGLALSGGGFRAMLFNLGSVWRLNDAGWLRQIDAITSVSGGSILNGVLATHWRDLEWRERSDGSVAANFEEVIAQPILRFAGQTIDVSAVLLRLIAGSASVEVASKYDEYLYHGARLQTSVPDFSKGETPRFLFYATNLQSGSNVRIERKRFADYRVGEVRNPDLAVSLVVAASSAFPPFLSPVAIEFPDSAWTRTCGAYLYEHPEFRRRLKLTDGGVYDNMGLEAIWDRCRTVLVSDAGAPLEFDPAPDERWGGQMLRVFDIVTEQTRALRRRKLMEDFKQHQELGEASREALRRGSYWGIKTEIGRFGLADPLARDTPVTRSLQHIRTRLNGFSAEEQGRLVNWGYALADAAMRRWVAPKLQRPEKLPMSDVPL